MTEITYKPKGVCSTLIHIAVDGGIVTRLRFDEGCSGNLEGLSRLVEGMPVDEVIRRLRGIRCGRKKTSCPDQLVKALEELGKEKDDSKMEG